MAFPKVLYVRKHGRADPRTFEMAASHVSLVGNDPVEIATYHLVSTTRWKRDVVQLFGKAGLEMIPILNRGSAAFDESRKQAERKEWPKPPRRPPELRSARRKR
jgi:hypothetical protein